MASPHPQRRNTPNRKAAARFIRLKDGRLIYSPGNGVRFTRDEIRAAVKHAIEQRRAREAAG
ncbi:MAG: hypothetical protein AAF253_06015 [Pseudomonadota bacterium]